MVANIKLGNFFGRLGTTNYYIDLTCEAEVKDFAMKLRIDRRTFSTVLEFTDEDGKSITMKDPCILHTGINYRAFIFEKWNVWKASTWWGDSRSISEDVIEFRDSEKKTVIRGPLNSLS